MNFKETVGFTLSLTANFVNDEEVKNIRFQEIENEVEGTITMPDIASVTYEFGLNKIPNKEEFLTVLDKVQDQVSESVGKTMRLVSTRDLGFHVPGLDDFREV